RSEQLNRLAIPSFFEGDATPEILEGFDVLRADLLQLGQLLLRCGEVPVVDRLVHALQTRAQLVRGRPRRSGREPERSQNQHPAAKRATDEAPIQTHFTSSS